MRKRGLPSSRSQQGTLALCLNMMASKLPKGESVFRELRGLKGSQFKADQPPGPLQCLSTLRSQERQKNGVGPSGPFHVQSPSQEHPFLPSGL